MVVAASSGCKSRPQPPVEGPRLVGYIPGYTAQCRSLTDCESLGGVLGFDPRGLWRPLRFSSAPFGVLCRAAECRGEYESRQTCGYGVPVDATSCRPVRVRLGVSCGRTKADQKTKGKRSTGEAMPTAGDGEVMAGHCEQRWRARSLPDATNDGEECGMSEWCSPRCWRSDSCPSASPRCWRRLPCDGGRPRRHMPIGALELAGAGASSLGCSTFGRCARGGRMLLLLTGRCLPTLATAIRSTRRLRRSFSLVTPRTSASLSRVAVTASMATFVRWSCSVGSPLAVREVLADVPGGPTIPLAIRRRVVHCKPSLGHAGLTGEAVLSPHEPPTTGPSPPARTNSRMLSPRPSPTR